MAGGAAAESKGPDVSDGAAQKLLEPRQARNRVQLGLDG